MCVCVREREREREREKERGFIDNQEVTEEREKFFDNQRAVKGTPHARGYVGSIEEGREGNNEILVLHLFFFFNFGPPPLFFFNFGPPPPSLLPPPSLPPCLLL